VPTGLAEDGSTRKGSRECLLVIERLAWEIIRVSRKLLPLFLHWRRRRFGRLGFLSGSHQIDAALERETLICALTGAAISSRGGQTLKGEAFELIEIKGENGRRGGLRGFSGLIPYGDITVGYEWRLRNDILGDVVVVAVIDVKPAIDKGVIVVSALKGIRRIRLTTRIRGAIWDGVPRFIGANKMNGFNLGAITFIGWGVSVEKEI
jgi:hypothetical protein